MTNQPTREFSRTTSACPPETGFLKLPQIIGNPKATPPIPPLIPVSRSTWLDGVKSGRYPPSVKIGSRAVAWKIKDILKLIDSIGAEA
jgi:hypothetical protein